ncbi:DUF4340 domain-containing protein [Paenibacillus eucommiae]|uniref:DUF4340 domain-containing protein n=1 Tax=Paenibacillus eucommiae TaxID=1355755 RepID=A0ABS4J0Q2_9BACL|nr:DUF4340 domain-containing protein [Paenibacillus eucommiae]MBP1992696.1 hypothetical protein [Paenibacillus eucommiae]
MKRLIPTILLVIVCIGGFWYASSHDFFREKIEEPQVLLPVKKEEVQSVSIQTTENQIELQNKENGWFMDKPSPLPLNQNQINSWIDTYGMLTSDAVIEENAADLSVYGLDKPSQVYKVTMKDGSVNVLQVGESLPIQGYLYAKLEGTSTVYQVSEQSISSLNKKAFDFMDASPVKFDNDQVQGIKFTWKGKSWSLTKTDKDTTAAGAAWKLGEKELAGSDAAVLLNQLTFLSTAEAAKPAAEISLEAAELNVEISLSAEGKETTEKYQGKLDADPGEKLWLVKQGGDWAYAISTADIQALADALEEKTK